MLKAKVGSKEFSDNGNGGHLHFRLGTRYRNHRVLCATIS